MLLPPPRKVMCSSLFVCLFVSNFAQKLWNGFAWNFQGRVVNCPMNKWLNFGGSPDHRLNTGIVFRICHCWEIRKMLSTDCASRHYSAWHALAGIAIATVTSLRHRPTTDSHDRRALVEVCTVPVLLVCSYCVRFSFFTSKARDWLGRSSPKWPILCQVGRKTWLQSTCCHVQIFPKFRTTKLVMEQRQLSSLPVNF